jgi:2-hydroxy-3-oxopropionate reductase
VNIGFIGLGVMGRPMAEHLIKAGHRLQLASRSGVPSGMADGDVVNCASAAEAARDADIIITMVPDTPDVEAVLFGPAGVAESAKPGSIVVDMSSISPLASKQFAARLGERGIGCLDAPVSGGEVGAKAGSLTIMVGGPTDLFEKGQAPLRADGPQHQPGR